MAMLNNQKLYHGYHIVICPSTSRYWLLQTKPLGIHETDSEFSSYFSIFFPTSQYLPKLYPLVICQNSYWKWPFIVSFSIKIIKTWWFSIVFCISIKKWWFSIVFCMFTRGYPETLEVRTDPPFIPWPSRGSGNFQSKHLRVRRGGDVAPCHEDWAFHEVEDFFTY